MTTVRVRGVILQGDKLLLVKHPHRDFWCLPGGKVDPGEPLLQAMERELIEELGVKPKVGRLLYVHQFTHDGDDNLDFFFEITNPTAFTDINLAQTTHGAQEITELSFVDPTQTMVEPEFLAKLTPGLLADPAQIWPKFTQT